MITLVWRTDVHLSDVSPSSRKDDWASTVLGKLRQVGMVADRVRAAAVLDGGDFFHVKSPSRNTHDLVRRVADLHATYPCPVYANVGNHDCVYGDYEYLDQQPLGVLFSTGVFRRCYDEHEVVFEAHDIGRAAAHAGACFEVREQDRLFTFEMEQGGGAEGLEGERGRSP